MFLECLMCPGMPKTCLDMFQTCLDMSTHVSDMFNSCYIFVSDISIHFNTFCKHIWTCSRYVKPYSTYMFQICFGHVHIFPDISRQSKHVQIYARHVLTGSRYIQTCSRCISDMLLTCPAISQYIAIILQKFLCKLHTCSRHVQICSRHIRHLAHLV